MMPHRVQPEPKKARGAQDRFVSKLSRVNRYLRRPGEASLLHIPAAVREKLVPRRGERRDMSHLASRHEGERG